ncbi:hypothetical protein [Cellulomonas gilvus]|uniref:Uncharacterized protein n=1 Tax=Cellulomonas gilvus (strain ATCC 13127 / NRRL B-14078) TaxID=593907 RepID=F8A2Y3_CELGA|nr:hypothetical protein [Cellulomonas gilvus]AEI11838.1 hypothetical protein Celgi_1319 [Cellulomonas gilvus ATCC 13127]
MTIDYAHTRTARENRDRKAATLAATARRLGITTDGIAIGGGQRRTVWREAGLDRSPSEDTWHLVHQALAAQPPAVPATAPRVAGPARAGACRVPGCVAASTSFYPSGWWCDEHSPWGRRGLTSSDPNRVPGQPCELQRLRAARGTTPTSYSPPTSTVIDDRAIASGKRRSTTATFQAVKAAQDHRTRARRTA